MLDERRGLVCQNTDGVAIFCSLRFTPTAHVVGDGSIGRLKLRHHLVPCAMCSAPIMQEDQGWIPRPPLFNLQRYFSDSDFHDELLGKIVFTKSEISLTDAMAGIATHVSTRRCCSPTQPVPRNCTTGAPSPSYKIGPDKAIYLLADDADPCVYFVCPENVYCTDP